MEKIKAIKQTAVGTGHVLLGAGALAWVGGMLAWEGLKVVGGVTAWTIGAKMKELKEKRELKKKQEGIQE